MYTVKIKRMTEDAILPERAHKGDAGLDVFAAEECVIESGEFRSVGTAICIELPERTEAQMRPRSGLALKHGVTLLNSPGTVDEGYRGEIRVIMINHGKSPFRVEKGMKIAQMVVKPVYDVEIAEVQVLSSSDRSERGFGSSGNFSKGN